MENMAEFFIAYYQKSCSEVLTYFLKYSSYTAWSSFPKAGEPESWLGWSSVWNAAQVYSLLLVLGATIEVLTLHPDAKALADKLLDTTLKTSSKGDVKKTLKSGQDEANP